MDWLLLIQLVNNITEVPDGGPVYTETNLDRIIAEPWNAFSSLLYIVPAIYWLIKLRGKYNSYPFITYCIPLLILGGLGSTFYHAFRSSPFFLLWDVLPITILTLSVGIYFWTKVINKWWKAILLVIVPVYFVQYILHQFFNSQLSVNISYFITGLNIFVPVIILLFRTDFYKSSRIYWAVLFLSIGLFFREADTWNYTYLWMGTHFLWHAFTALGAYFLADYLYYFQRFSIRKKQEVRKAA